MKRGTNHAAVDIQARRRATSFRTVLEAANKTTASTAAIAGTMNIAEWSPSARNGSSAAGKLILGPPNSARTCPATRSLNGSCSTLPAAAAARNVK